MLWWRKMQSLKIQHVVIFYQKLTYSKTFTRIFMKMFQNQAFPMGGGGWGG